MGGLGCAVVAILGHYLLVQSRELAMSQSKLESAQSKLESAHLDLKNCQEDMSKKCLMQKDIHEKFSICQFEKTATNITLSKEMGQISSCQEQLADKTKRVQALMLKTSDPQSKVPDALMIAAFAVAFFAILDSCRQRSQAASAAQEANRVREELQGRAAALCQENKVAADEARTKLAGAEAQAAAL